MKRESGKIGCWEITNSALYNGIAYTGAQDSDSCGMGTYGGNWAFWAGNGKFSVKQNGELYAKNATIEGKVVSNDITATNGTFTNVTIGKNCNITGDCYIAGRVWGAGFNINTDCGIDARTLGTGFTWNGNTVGSGFLDGVLSGKTLSICVTSGSLGIGSSSNYINASGGTINIQSSSAVNVATSAGTVISCLQDKVTIRNLEVGGSKNRIIKTTNYGTVSLASYETPEPMFGDVGTGQLDDNGEIYIFLDPMLLETIEAKYQYKVFLTKYGKGELYVDMDRSTTDYFVICGKPNLKFAWEIKTIQKDMINLRFASSDFSNADLGNSIDYEAETEHLLQEYEGEIEYAV